MSIWRKVQNEKTGETVYHCDEHGFHATEGSDIESHLKVHGKHLGSFWGRKHDHNLGITVYTCGDHNFSTRNPVEIEEHERSHAETAGIPWMGW